MEDVTFNKVAGFTVFFTFFKLYKWCQIAQRITLKIGKSEVLQTIHRF